MGRPMGEAESNALWLDFNRRFMLQFRGCVGLPPMGLLAYRELDDVLGLTVMAGWPGLPMLRNRVEGDIG